MGIPDFTAEAGEVLPLDVPTVPKIVDIRDGVAIYDDAQSRKQLDWTYAPAGADDAPRVRVSYSCWKCGRCRR